MADPGRTRVIVNPSSGRGRAAARVAQVRTLVDETVPHAEWHASRSAAHLTDLCQEAAARQYARVVVLGGDGTIHHAVRGLVNSATALGIIPLGTGNDFARAAGIPTDPLAATRLLSSCAVMSVDVGAVDGVPFCCVAGVGMDTPALRYIERSRIAHKQLLYHLAAMRTLIGYAAPEITMDLDGETIRDRVLFAAFCNTATYAGGNPVAPRADIRDGRLDYCVFLDRPLHQRALTLMRMRRARHLGRPGVLSGVGCAFGIDSEVPVPITLDGELTSMTTPARVHLLPAALRVVGPVRAP